MSVLGLMIIVLSSWIVAFFSMWRTQECTKSLNIINKQTKIERENAVDGRESQEMPVKKNNTVGRVLVMELVWSLTSCKTTNRSKIQVPHRPSNSTIHSYMVIRSVPGAFRGNKEVIFHRLPSTSRCMSHIRIYAASRIYRNSGSCGYPTEELAERTLTLNSHWFYEHPIEVIIQAATHRGRMCAFDLIELRHKRTLLNSLVMDSASESGLWRNGNTILLTRRRSALAQKVIIQRGSPTP